MKAIVILFIFISVLLSAYFMLQYKDTDVPASPVDKAKSTVGITLPMTENASIKPALPMTVNSNPAINSGNNQQRSHKQEKPLEPEIHEAVRQLVNTSHEGLVEEQRADGVEVNLKGRFRAAPVATINEQGEVTVRDYTSAPVE